MKDWRGILRKIAGDAPAAAAAFTPLTFRISKLFVLRPNDGAGKEFTRALDRFESKIGSAVSEDEVEQLGSQIYATAEAFSKTQKLEIDAMVSEVTNSAGELLEKLGRFVELQSDRINEIEKVRSNITAAQSAKTLDGMRELLTVSLDGLQEIVHAELQRQNDLRSDHETYAARLQVKLETVEKESRTDVLTGVANRNGCMKKLNSVIDYVKTHRRDYRLVLIDLNGFKKINDTLGHAAGDAALVAFTTRLVTAVGKDGFVGRLAGDEFIVISNTPLATLQAVLLRLREQFATMPASYKGIQLDISFCYGISSIDGKSEPTAILEQADIELYRHKNDFYLKAA